MNPIVSKSIPMCAQVKVVCRTVRFTRSPFNVFVVSSASVLKLFEADSKQDGVQYRHHAQGQEGRK